VARALASRKRKIKEGHFLQFDSRDSPFCRLCQTLKRRRKGNFCAEARTKKQKGFPAKQFLNFSGFSDLVTGFLICGLLGMYWARVPDARGRAGPALKFFWHSGVMQGRTQYEYA